jgi:hypothetical protein
MTQAVQAVQDFSTIEAPSAGGEAASVLLHRMHVEMIALAEGVMAVQTALSPIFAAHAHMSGDGIRETQRLDLIEQTLRALAEIATHASVSSEAGPLDLDEITKICRLSDLAERLRGGAAAGTDGDKAELELF